ncbi:hypothetical protein [Pandoraea fibrosis]|nr:hypothetical protein [Pandoraea fibrosis]
MAFFMAKFDESMRKCAGVERIAHMTNAAPGNDAERCGYFMKA